MPMIGTSIFGFGTMMTLYVPFEPLRSIRTVAEGADINLINLFTSMFALQPPDPSIPRGYIHLRSFCAVRGVGASLWLSFIR